MISPGEKSYSLDLYWVEIEQPKGIPHFARMFDFSPGEFQHCMISPGEKYDILGCHSIKIYIWVKNDNLLKRQINSPKQLCPPPFMFSFKIWR